MAKCNKIKLINSIVRSKLSDAELKNIIGIIEQPHSQDSFIYYVDGIKLTYDYERKLTKELDSLDKNYNFTLDDIYKITLWKVNRFPDITTDNDFMQRFNELAKYDYEDFDDETKQKTIKVLRDLLNVKGVRLPMASTYLRFRNPKLFQIIDQRVWRVVQEYRKEADTTLRHCRNIDDEIDKYLKYLETLRELAGKHNIAFENADRAFYVWDIYHGHNVEY